MACLNQRISEYARHLAPVLYGLSFPKILFGRHPALATTNIYLPKKAL